MKKIHWSVYIIMGLFISAASYKLNYQKLIFFFYLGLIFVLVGIARLIIGKNENKRQMQKQPIRQFKRCMTCNNIVRISEHFCNKCGARV